jgi:hypothetical protein
MITFIIAAHKRGTFGGSHDQRPAVLPGRSVSSHRRPTRRRSPNHGCLYRRLTRFYVASPLNPIFMLGGTPEAHGVLSKTPRIDIPFAPKVCPKAFPIKASDNPPVRFLFSAKGYLALQFVNEVFEKDDMA